MAFIDILLILRFLLDRFLPKFGQGLPVAANNRAIRRRHLIYGPLRRPRTELLGYIISYCRLPRGLRRAAGLAIQQKILQSCEKFVIQLIYVKQLLYS
jgi:hypothetical protein